MESICSLCGEKCYPEIVDEGIGMTEYWGAPKRDVQLVAQSSCCKERVMNQFGELITVSEAKKIIEERFL